MNMKNSESGSDISSNASWTVIEEFSDSNKPNLEECSKPEREIDIEVIKTTEVFTIASKTKDDEFVKVALSDTSIKSHSTDDEDSDSSRGGRRDNGFLTFDEYLQERMLEHDYEYPNQSVFKNKLNKSRNFLRGRKKCKAEAVGVLSLCASLLTVTGIALLCLVFPENVDNKNFDVIKSNYQAIASNDSLDYNNIVSSFNKTIDILNTANNTKLFLKCADSLKKSSEETKPYKRVIGPMTEARSNKYRLGRKHRNALSTTNIFRSDVCFPREKHGVCYPNEDPKFTPEHVKRSSRIKPDDKINSTKSGTKLSSHDGSNVAALSAVQSVLASTNLRRIIRAIIHDICILKLMSYFNNSGSSTDHKRKSNKGGQKSSKRKLLEAIADGFSRMNLEQSKVKKIKTTRRKTKSKKRTQRGSSNVTALSVSLPSTIEVPKKNIAPPYSKYENITSTNVVTNELRANFENGKSECERRFEELDSHRKKSKEMCSKHRVNIQQIKEQYLTEIDAIKGSNIEPLVRLHRIQTLRENYRLQLKRNRELYIKEMCKIKRLRAKMLKDLCAQKRNELEVRDASVGSYVVPIDENFYSRLQKIKEKEGTSISLPHFQENTKPIFQIPSAKDLGKSFSSPFQLQPSLADSMKNEIVVEPRHTMKMKKLKEKLTTDIPSVFGLSLNFDLNRPVENSHNINDLDKDQESWNEGVETSRSLKREYSGESEFSSAKNRKKIEGHLYHVAFEKKGEMIRKADNLKWKQQRIEEWEKYRREISKHDPQKCFKQNIMVYKY